MGVSAFLRTYIVMASYPKHFQPQESLREGGHPVPIKSVNTANLFHRLKKYHQVEYKGSLKVHSSVFSQPSRSGVSFKQQSIFATITLYRKKKAPGDNKRCNLFHG